ncbi:MAG: helix-turn-helix domain-containing protein [Rhodomicrobium sp.]
MNLSVAVTPPYDGEAKLGRASLIYESVLSGAMSRSYTPKQDIFCEGDPRRSVYRVESGAVCLYKCMADGKRQIFDFAFPADLIGLGASNTHSCGAQAIGPSQLKAVPLTKLYELASRDPGFALGLYQAVSQELESTRDLLLTIAQLDSLERVAIFLLTLSQGNARAGKNPRLLTIPMTRSDIGDLLGTTIETVSRSLTRLRQEKLIDIIRGSLIQIIDMEGLKALAGQMNYH